MTNNTKKQLADAISKVLFQGEYVTKDSGNGHYYERLGYIMIDDNDIVGREPVMLAVTDNDKTLVFEYTDPENPKK